MQRQRGSASRLHGIDLPTDVRSAWVMETRRTALVLGSAQLGTNIQQVIFNGGTNSAYFHTATSSVRGSRATTRPRS